MTTPDTNRPSGSGSDGRRKGIVRQAVAQPALIQNLTRLTTRQLRDLTAGLQQQLDAEVRAHFDDLVATFDIIRSENAAAEGERDRALWERVGEAVAEGRTRWESLLSVVQ
jgi:hypothetical protein